MFPLVFGELAQVEMPFLAYLLGNEGSDDPKECGDRIVENFVLDNQAVSDLVYRRMEKVLSPEEYYAYEKIYVLNEISDTFNNAKKLKNKGKDKEAKEELDKLFSKLQYKCFYAEKVDDRIKVVVPAEDYNYDNYRVKEFLKNHPEKTDRKYNDDDLEYQLRFVKSIAAYPCSEQNVKREVFDGYDKTIPSGNDRKRYVLREIRAAFEVEAK
jgi:hypothetical protein